VTDVKAKAEGEFRDAVDATPNLLGAWKPGLRALRAEDKPHIQPEDARMILGSVDVDTALTSTAPNANRWDFAIGYKHANRDEPVLYWVELHTAADAQMKVVIRKLEWLLGWLESDGRKLGKFERDFIWVASGPTAFTDSANQIKRMAQKGLRYVGNSLRILDSRPPQGLGDKQRDQFKRGKRRA